jgi:hypothetical protein
VWESLFLFYSGTFEETSSAKEESSYIFIPKGCGTFETISPSSGSSYEELYEDDYLGGGFDGVMLTGKSFMRILLSD